MLDFPERRLLLRACVSAVVGLVLIALDPLGLDRRSEQASNDVFLRFAAPLLGKRLSPYPVVVVLITQNGMNRLNPKDAPKDTAKAVATDKPRGTPQNNKAAPPKWTWPFSFAQQALILGAIADYAPRAIFYDVAFYQDRGGAPKKLTGNEFAATIRETTGKTGPSDPGCLPRIGAGHPKMPVFLSLVPRAIIQPTLCAAGAEGVRVDWSAPYNTYPLDFGPIDAHPAQGAPRFLTPAARLFDELCGPDADQGPKIACPQAYLEMPQPAPLSVAWATGVDPDPDQGYFTDITGCDLDSPRSWSRRVVEAFSALFADLGRHGDSGPKPCFNTRYVTFDQFVRPFDQKKLREALAGRVVMVGTDLPGINDVVYSPAQGEVPGVFMHAAALENLLHWGNGRFRDLEEGGLAWWLLQVSSCAVVTAMIYGSVQAVEWFRRNPPSLRILAYSTRGPGPRLAKDAAVDLLQLLALAVAIVAILLLLTLIAFFGFRIAPLNWVGMAALVLGLTLDEIGGTAADALIVLAMTVSPARRLARVFFPHPSLE